MINWFEKHYKISLLIAILIAIFIFYLSAKSFEKGAPGPEFPFKSVIYHFFIFLIFTFFLIIFLTKGEQKNKIFIMIGILIALAYSTTDEIHQFFVPNRYSSVNDFLIDSAGVLIAGVFYSFRMRTRLH